MIQSLIDSALILEALAATSKQEAIDEILTASTEAGRVTKANAAKVRDKIVEREARGSTGIGNGVAVPHVKLDTIEDTAIVLARSPDGIEYEAIDGRPVHTVFLILAPADAAEEHLQLLRWISGLARNADFRRFLGQAKDEAEIRDLLREMAP
jgi:mannitol/fructose-specific phosphotransferase system IIA component (Ntr-type)